MRSALPTLLSLSVACTAAGWTVPAYAGGHVPVFPLTQAVTADEPAAVLGLEAPDDATGETLSKALRKSFANRGWSGGEELSLVEMRLTMGCENDEPKCLAQAGQALNVRKLVYGYLKPKGTGGDFSLELFVLDVGSGAIEAQATTPLSAADLSNDRIQTTADRVVAGILGEDETATPPPEPPPVAGAPEGSEGTPAGSDRRGPARDDGGLEWGYHPPIAKWKWAGFGVSVGVLVASVTAAATLGYMVDPPGDRIGPIRKDLLDAAQGSLEDDKPSNDVDPNIPGIDLCEVARTNPPGDPNPEAVTNAAVTKVCNRADGMRLGANIAWGVVGVSAVSTVVFTTLLFVHRSKPGARAMLRRGVRITAGPRPEGGAMMGGSLRF